MNNTREKMIKTIMLYSDVNQGVIKVADMKEDIKFTITYDRMWLSSDENKLIFYKIVDKKDIREEEEIGTIQIDKLNSVSIYSGYIKIVLR